MGARGALAGRDVLSVADLTAAELALVLETAARIKSGEAATGSDSELPLRGRHVALLFEKPSLRTKSSFLVGAARLGAHAACFGRDEVDLGRRESIPDGARVLSRYWDALVFRTFGHERVEELAEAASIPVINALSDHEHPCQALADLMTLREAFGALDGLTLAWVGDGNNVCHSLMLACALSGTAVRVATPEGHEPDAAVVAEALRLGGSIELLRDADEAVEGAHCVTTDTWISMGQEKEAAARRKTFSPYTVDERLMARARPDAIFLHCLPAHRGEEVSDAVMDGPASRILDQAENRVHAQQALLLEILR